MRIDRRKLDLPESIKRIGRYQIPVELFGDATATLRVAVHPEGGELPPQEELDAIAAAEAEAEAAAQAEADAEHEQAEAVIEAVVAEEELEPDAEEEAEQVPEDAFDRAADAADELPGRLRAARLVTEAHRLLHSSARSLWNSATNFPLRARISPTGVVRGSWEPVFPYACKPATSDRSTALSKAASSRPFTTAAAVLG